MLLFRGWGLESRVGSEAQARLRRIRSDIEARTQEAGTALSVRPRREGLPRSRWIIQLSFRGDPDNLVGPEIPRHFLSVLSEGEPKPFSKGSGRLELAEAILKQPLAMRVIVNRIWQGHFGTGIVDTPSNFGMTGERPTQSGTARVPGKLSSSKNGMSMKKLHREIMLSSVYQLSTDERRGGLRQGLRAIGSTGARIASGWMPSRFATPSCSWLGQSRQVARRTIGRADSRVQAPNGLWQGEPLQARRVPATVRLPESEHFSAEKRFVTTVPLQRLFLMNSDFMQIQAEELAKRVAAEPTTALVSGRFTC